MMGSVWLTCCSREAYARLFTEVRARDVQANVLRFGGMGDLSHMIDGFPNQDVNAALVAEAGDEVRYMADVVLPALPLSRYRAADEQGKFSSSPIHGIRHGSPGCSTPGLPRLLRRARWRRRRLNRMRHVR